MMIGPNFADDVDCGSFFDHIDDLLDFPTDDVDAGLPASDAAAAFPSIWNAQSESLPSTDSVFSGNSASDLSAELSVPYEDIVQLEWLSNFVEDSFSGGSLTINNKQLGIEKGSSSSSHQLQFHTASPVSVLESSSSCSGDNKTAPEEAAVAPRCGRGRARSKRPRPPTFQPRPAIQLISPSSSVNESESPNPFVVPRAPSDSENYAESRLLIKIPKHGANPEQHKKMKKKKIKFSAAVESSNQGQTVRKCMHCEITKTPQWRAGPMGPKTLCNACGVRYKSGRLFPEYRPAASPTFVPSLHSNSHKKVVEMRTKGVFAPGPMAPDSPELIPNNTTLALQDYI